jgi:hypothetical protein
MSRTPVKGVPIDESGDDLTPPPADAAGYGWAHRQIARLHTRVAVVESSHDNVRRDFADIKLASNEQGRSLSKIELGMVGIQTTMAHISSELARSNQRNDTGGKNSADWIRWVVQVVVTIAAVLVAVYAASKK